MDFFAMVFCSFRSLSAGLFALEVTSSPSIPNHEADRSSSGGGVRRDSQRGGVSAGIKALTVFVHGRKDRFGLRDGVWMFT